EQEDWTERFKTDNALLQNSLSYFQVFSARLSAERGNEQLSRHVSDLAAALLELASDTSPAAAAAVDARLAAMPAPNTQNSHPTALESLTAHARMLRQLLPETDGIVRALFALPTDSQRAALTAIWKSRRADAKRSGAPYR